MLPMKQIQLQDKLITLIQTAHVSKQSVLDVQEAITSLKPDAVCIELDQARAQKLNSPVDYSSMKLIDVIRQKKIILVTVNYVLGQYQKKIADNMESKVGDEMRMGIQEAQKLAVPISYIDRDVQITFKRIWSHLSFMEKLKLFWSLLDSDEAQVSELDIEHLKKADVLNDALSEVSQAFPTVHRILVTERDQYMAQSIKNTPGRHVLAVIGAAHGPGIEHYLTQPDINLQELETIKPPTTLSRVMKWILPLLFILLILLAFGFDMDGLKQLGNYVLWVSIASAIGAALCLAHPVTILVSFFTAFISAISPIFSVGWFAGISEAYFRAPTVGDFETLNADAKSIKGVFKNNILRTLLVMIVTSLFSVLTTLFFSLDSVRTFIQNLF